MVNLWSFRSPRYDSRAGILPQAVLRSPTCCVIVLKSFTTIPANFCRPRKFVGTVEFRRDIFLPKIIKTLVQKMYKYLVQIILMEKYILFSFYKYLPPYIYFMSHYKVENSPVQIIHCHNLFVFKWWIEWILFCRYELHEEWFAHASCSKDWRGLNIEFHVFICHFT